METRSTLKPQQRPCECGQAMRPAVRYEATRTVNVWWCLNGCGREDPPLYGQCAAPVLPYCRYCGERFTQTDPRQRYCPDRDCADRADRITLDRRFNGQRIRRRRSA